MTHATLDEMVELLQHELTSLPPESPRHTPMRLVLRSGPAASPQSESITPEPLPPPPGVPAEPVADEATDGVTLAGKSDEPAPEPSAISRRPSGQHRLARRLLVVCVAVALGALAMLLR